MAKRALFAIQVEVTSRCTRSCAVCPRSAFADSWLEGDLSAGLWQRLRPDLRLARHVHLQGWGEPLLHRSPAPTPAIANCGEARPLRIYCG